MFGKPRNQNALEPPPIAKDNPRSVEVLRVWAAPGEPQELTLRTTWKDAGAWGLMFHAEWAGPTDMPQDISGA